MSFTGRPRHDRPMNGPAHRRQARQTPLPTQVARAARPAGPSSLPEARDDRDPTSPTRRRTRRAGRRMNRSRAIAAGTSVGALVVLTAGVAVANPGIALVAAVGDRVELRAASDAAVGRDDDSDGGDTGWLARRTTPRRLRRLDVDPNSGWTPAQTRVRAASTPASAAAAATRAVAAAEHVVDVMGTRAHVIVTAADLELAEILGARRGRPAPHARSAVVAVPRRQRDHRAEPRRRRTASPCRPRPCSSSSARSRRGTAPTARSTPPCCPPRRRRLRP